ncbi:protein neprosin-like [Tasmannia lanceolata]|uniref:protein neprosin-like n=1 Tax=Tasmannia lanceolata TaxID=3420 RepID=UPI004063666A
MSLKEMFLLLFLLLSLGIIGNIAEGRGSISMSKEEDLELERQLKIINKPAVKTIKTRYGQVFSCVDINKQPAFDHPLLKNHKIQMSLGSLPKGIKDKKASSLDVSLKIGFKNGGCPLGTVPIRRIKKEDLIRAKSSPNFGKGYPSNALSPSNGQGHFNFALQSTLKGDGGVYGSRAVLNVWEPKIIARQNSAALVILLDASPSEQRHAIQAGWMVNNDFYNDFHPHLYTGWTNDNFGKTGCHDVLCSGFVQISKHIPVGASITPSSVYNGTQHYIIVTVYKDPASKDWWLLYGEERVGYWPKVIFNSTFADYADFLQWGGVVYNDGVLPWPEMGSGHMPEVGQEYRKSSYIGGMQFIDEDGNGHSIKLETPREMIRTSPSCYQIGVTEKVPGEAYAILFGGPGYLIEHSNEGVEVAHIIRKSVDLTHLDNGQPLGQFFTEVQITVALQPKEPLIRESELNEFIGDALGGEIAWPSFLMSPEYLIDIVFMFLTYSVRS